MSRSILITLAALLTPIPAWGDVISLNFVGGGSSLLSTDQAGNPNVSQSFTTNWNNLTGASGTNVALVDGSGAATGVTTSYTAGIGTFLLTNTTLGANLAGGANPQMMSGYLDAAAAASTVTLSNLSQYFLDYQVLVYFDGSNGTAWRVGTYTITDPGANVLFSGFGEDSENVNFNIGSGNNADGVFQIPTAGGSGNVNWPNSPNNNEGNLLISGLLTADSFTLTAQGTSAVNATLRAAVNGIQIIGTPVPEPGTMLIVASMLLPLSGLYFRRRTPRGACIG